FAAAAPSPTAGRDSRTSRRAGIGNQQSRLAGMSTDALLELAVKAAHTAGELLLGRFGGPQSGVDAKSSATDMVSDADRDAERLLLDAISSARPDDGLIAEESGHQPGTTGRVWVIDPLDGTTNYLYG